MITTKDKNDSDPLLIFGVMLYPLFAFITGLNPTVLMLYLDAEFEKATNRKSRVLSLSLP